MNRFLHALLFGPPGTVLLSGTATEPRPCTDTERELNAWRLAQYRQRLASWVRIQDEPEEAEKAVTRAFETGLLVRTSWLVRWARKERGQRPVVQLASRRKVN